MSILTDQQIRAIRDDVVRRSFVLHNNLDDNIIVSQLLKGLILTGQTYKDRLLELYTIYTNAEKRKWSMCNVNGLKTLMIQKGISKIQCFGCERELQFNELEFAILIRIYRQTDSFYICCNLCTPNCPTIDMTANDAQKFYVGKRGNIKAIADEKMAIDKIINDIKSQIQNSKHTIETLQSTANELDNDIFLHTQIVNDKLAQLEKIANREQVIEGEIKKQAILLKSITDTEQQTTLLKGQYENLFTKQFEMANKMEEMHNTVENMKQNAETILTQFETDIQEKNKQMLETLTANLGKKTKEIVESMDNIESISESITEKLSYDFKCGVCTGRKSPIWAYDCGHTLCKGCIDELDKCPICSAESENKRQIYL